jgi:hypothetical protein
VGILLTNNRYKRLHDELLTNSQLPDSSKQDIQSLPYLSAIIRETLRISMANPTRLPHIVPPSGFTFPLHSSSPSSPSSSTSSTIYIPPKTLIGCSAHSLHFSSEVFPNPHSFLPERWLSNVTPEMNTSFFAWGAGSRACIARNLATMELFMATERVVLSGVLEGARADGEVEIYEWFNSSVKGGKIELVW